MTNDRRFLALLASLAVVVALLSWAVLGASTTPSGYTTVEPPTGGVTLTIHCHTGFHRVTRHPYCVKNTP